MGVTFASLRPGRHPFPVRIRLLLVTMVALVATIGAVVVGGLPLLVALGGLVIGVGVLLPPGSRRYLLQRAWRIGVTVFIAMAIVWLLVHNYPDASRQTPHRVRAGHGALYRLDR